MKEKLTIGEIAKLRGLTTETLRHYDRINLFKPQYIDPNSKYRYYSIFQYETLGTIKELRQLGMSTDEIKYYFNERNLAKSTDILKQKHADLVLKINELNDLEENIRKKIKYLEQIRKANRLHDVTLRNIRSRKLITLNEKANNNLELSYSIIRLENTLEEKAPILASNRLGIIIEKTNLIHKSIEVPSTVFVVANGHEKVKKQNLKLIPAGLFACIHYNGELLSHRSESINKVLNFINTNCYQINGDAIQIMHIDITVSDEPEEISFEIQVPIKKS